MILGAALVLALCSLAATFGGALGVAFACGLLALLFAAVEIRNWED